MKNGEKTEEGKLYRFHFGTKPQEGYIRVPVDGRQGAPLFSETAGYGFVNRSCSIPPRAVFPERIRPDGRGAVIVEPEFDEIEAEGADHSNRYGIIFRIAAPPGVYDIRVKTVSAVSDTRIAVSGMAAGRLLEGGSWDAAGLVPVRNTAVWADRVWTYRYANGRPFIDIEIEPDKPGVPVGVEEIELRPLPRNSRREGERPSVYLLGDSTVKSYTFDEAPMCGWGQTVHRLFDRSRVNVVNYSMGGRSFKNAYGEGRLNDLLVTACEGDTLLIQFGHNDERTDEHLRYGRGSTEESYEAWIRDVYLPAIRARGVVPLLVTPVSRIQGDAEPGHVYTNSFRTRMFPDILRRLGRELDTAVLDLNAASVNYYNRLGVEGTTAVFMSIEAGETPGRTNDGTYANGHPANKIDGTHFKEALARQLARMVVTELTRLGDAGCGAAQKLASFLKAEVRAAVASGDWSAVYPETARDTLCGEGAYYRNQIEKMLQLGVMQKDGNGCFRPASGIGAGAFAEAAYKLMGVPRPQPEAAGEGAGDVSSVLTREWMAAVLADVYHTRFRDKPVYMTGYNGKTRGPGDPGYDPNLDSGMGARGSVYGPLVPYDCLEDLGDTDPALADKVREAYGLGLIRAENGIRRGRVMNGTKLEPKAKITRAQAAKALYFLWVLGQPPKKENHSI